MNPAKNLFLTLLAGLALLLGMSNAQAQDVKFECASYLVGQGELMNYENRCNPIGVDAGNDGIKELTKLATSVFFEQTYDPVYNPDAKCTYDFMTYSLNCSIGDRANPIKLSCANGYDPDTGAMLNNCSLNTANPDFAQAITMNCSKTYGGPNESYVGNCVFRLDRQPILDTMQSASNFGEMNMNERSIHDAFWSCLNRVGLSSENQARCDRIFLQLAEDPGFANRIVDVLRAVTPENSDISLDVSSFNIQHTLNSIVGRLSQLRNGIASHSVNIQYFDGQQWLDRHTLLAANNLSMNDASPDKPARNMSEYGRLGLFLNGSSIKTRQSASALEDRLDAGTQIATLGMDYRFTDTLVGGLAVNISQGNTDYGRNRGQLDNNSMALVLYGSYYIDNWYLDGNLNYGRDRYDQERNVTCKPTPVICPVGFTQSFGSDFEGSQMLVSLASGYQWQQEAWGITPFVQLNHARVKTDGYTEDPSSTGLFSGANFALSISEQERDTSTIKLGTNVQYTIPTSQGVVIPLVGLYGIRELENNSDLVTGQFIGNVATDGSFNLATNDNDQSYFIVAGGLNFQLKNGNAGFINVQGLQGYDMTDQVQVTAGWRWEL